MTLVPSHNPNDRFSVWNIIAIGCWVLLLLGSIAELITPLPGTGLG